MTKKNSQTCELLVELISSSIRDVDGKVLQNIIDRLHQVTGRAFGENIEKWVDWYMHWEMDSDDKEVVRIAYKSYLINLKILG
jgi:hypothetical protein